MVLSIEKNKMLIILNITKKSQQQFNRIGDSSLEHSSDEKKVLSCLYSDST